jgi:hypothetical protein
LNIVGQLDVDFNSRAVRRKMANKRSFSLRNFAAKMAFDAELSALSF